MAKNIVRSMVIQFITGGLIVSGTTYLTQFVSPKVAAIFWAFPFSLLPTIFFLWKGGEKIEKIKKYVTDTIPGMAVLLCFILGYVFSTKLEFIQKSKYGPLYSLIGAVLLWSIAAFIMYKFLPN